MRVKGDEHNVTYVFFDTGIEMAATKRHLDYLEQKYGIEIVRRRAKVTVPAAVQKYGYPYLSKDAAQRIHELQAHDFDWSDGTQDELNERFPNCKSGISWWTGNKIRYGLPKIRHNYMHENPPDFSISHLCCKYSKKNPSAEMEKELNADLVLFGIRRSEGGVRASKGSCFDYAGASHKTDRYYPCFWWTNDDKAAFEKTYHIIHSDAYTIYGFSRTGCAGCPLNSKFEEELDIIRQYEPKLANAVEHIFAPSYKYTRNYRTYKEAHKKQSQKSKENLS